MILAAYRNPPYRSPTPRTNGNTNNNKPPSQQSALSRRSESPKRKREESVSEPEPSSSAPERMMLSVATTALVQEEVTESGANSPRTKVAERFRGLGVSDGEDVGAGLPSSSQSPRKKLKVEGDVTPSYSRELEIPDSEGPSSLMAMTEPEDVRMGSPSPAPAKVLIPPHRRTLAKVPSLRKESSYLSTRTEPTPTPTPSPPSSQQPPTSSPPGQSSKRRLSSPPPPPTLEPMSLTTTPLTSDTPSQSTSLTWQISEITGHDIDPSNPDDDGEGINGIGFKPTPAMAHARSMKRKKQVEEWKSREAREARQRRFERRKRSAGAGAGGEGNGGVDGAKRVVRFVDV